MAGWNKKTHRPYFFITAYVMVLAGLAALGYFEANRFEDAKNSKPIAAQIAASHESAPSVATNSKGFYRLPRMELTLSSFEGETHHARIGISIQVDKNNIERFADYQPRVSDRIIDYLRHQDVSEISKPSAMFDLHRDLLEEINEASDPIRVSDIVFREFIVR